jgi:hypothetical protein
VRRVEDDTHQQSTQETGNRDGHDPGESQETNSVEVDRLEGPVTETDTDGGAGDAHRRGDGERVLREDEDGQSGTHLHRRSPAGRVVGDLVAHNCKRERKEQVQGQ